MSTAEMRLIKPRQWHCGCFKTIVNEKREQSNVFFRYMDNILTCIKQNEEEELLKLANGLPKNLTFTNEREEDTTLPFLDMKIHRQDGKLSSAWYRKPTDTGFIMSLHECAPTRYKRNIIEGIVYRIHHATSNWTLFHQGLTEVKKMREHNSYPPSFYNSVVRSAIEKILSAKQLEKAQNSDNVQKSAKKEELHYFWNIESFIWTGS